MTALTDTPATSSRAPRGLRLRGLTWLVWRQHRAAFWTMLAGTAAFVCWAAFQRAQMMDYLNGYGWPHPKTDDWTNGFTEYYDWLKQSGDAVALVPILLGVFVGAPLLAGDLETGTAKLATTQSVSRVRWLAAKLCVSLCVVVVCTMALSFASGWWWRPVEKTLLVTWTDMPVFDTTGPVPTALTLFTVVAGVAIGMLARRVLTAMVVTFGFAVVVEIVWGSYELNLGRVTTVTTHADATGWFPQPPPGAIGLAQSFLTSSGTTVGWSSCGSEPSAKARVACLAKEHIVSSSTTYLPFSQMSAMQWFGATILLALTVAVVAFILLRARNRLI
jgi:hypothetical protein